MKNKFAINKNNFTMAAIIIAILLFVVIRVFPTNTIKPLPNQATYTESTETRTLPKKVFVQRVVDGDTFVDDQKRRYRLLGIDTPELKHHNQKEEPYAKKAKIFTLNKIEKKYVTLDYDYEKKDKYNRFLVYVYLPDGEMLNRILLEEGLADVYRKKPFKYKKEFYQIEEKAQKQQKNMWSN